MSITEMEKIKRDKRLQDERCAVVRYMREVSDEHNRRHLQLLSDPTAGWEPEKHRAISRAFLQASEVIEYGGHWK